MNLRSISVVTAPLCADQSATQGFRAVLVDLAETIWSRRQPTIDDEDTECLHELRIAIRRTRSVLANAKHVLPPATLIRFRDDFRWLAGLTGPTRDLDVFLAGWPAWVDGFDTPTAGALRPVIERLDQQRRDAFDTLAEGLQSERASRLLAEWSATLDSLGHLRHAQMSSGAETLGKVVAKRVKAAQKAVVATGRAITDTSPPEDLHEMRKAAKKLRYVTECFGGVLPRRAAKRFVRQLKALQDNLGGHQDAVVFQARLRSIGDELGHEDVSAATLVALGRLIERVDAIERTSRAEFAQRFDDYDSERTRAAITGMLDEIG